MDCYRSLLTFFIAARANSTALGAYPVANRLVTFSYSQNLGIIGLQPCSAFEIQTGPAGIAVVIGSNPDTLNLTDASDIYAVHVAEANDDAVTVTGNSVSDFISFEDYGVYLQQGQSVSIYGWGNGADNVLTSALVIHTILAK